MTLSSKYFANPHPLFHLGTNHPLAHFKGLSFYFYPFCSILHATIGQFTETTICSLLFPFHGSLIPTAASSSSNSLANHRSPRAEPMGLSNCPLFSLPRPFSPGLGSCLSFPWLAPVLSRHWVMDLPSPGKPYLTAATSERGWKATRRRDLPQRAHQSLVHPLLHSLH